MSERFERAIAAIDAANAADPNTIVIEGRARPKELVHAEVVSAWLLVLDPQATEVQRLAARAHHLRRWVVPRSDYPDGRAGYLRWRRDQQRRHATEVIDLLVDAGYGPSDAARVAQIVAKEGRTTDPEVQTHEDALCLTFLELQLDELTEQLGHDHMVEVARKTLAKMSDAAIARAGTLSLSPSGAAVVADASAR